MARSDLQCTIHPFGALEPVKYVVVCTVFRGQYLLSRHRERSTWETQGGHIEPGETALDAAKRELYEESGIREAKFYPVCDYLGVNPPRRANGTVYLAVAEELGALPDSEMAEITLFDGMPENLTYPHVTPRLFAEAEKVKEEILCKTF